MLLHLWKLLFSTDKWGRKYQTDEVLIKSCEDKFREIRYNETALAEEYNTLSEKYSQNYLNTFFDLINDDIPLDKACEIYSEIF